MDELELTREMAVKIPTATRISPPEIGSVQKVTVVSTGLKTYDVIFDQTVKGCYQTSSPQYWEFPATTGSFTTMSFVVNNSLYFATTVNPNLTEELLHAEDFVVKPKYLKEFKIKVGTLKFNRTLPKISPD